jgi:hypothetical protein
MNSTLPYLVSISLLLTAAIIVLLLIRVPAPAKKITPVQGTVLGRQYFSREVIGYMQDLDDEWFAVYRVELMEGPRYVHVRADGCLKHLQLYEKHPTTMIQAPPSVFPRDPLRDLDQGVVWRSSI